MTKDLFRLTFNEFSRWPYEKYRVNFLEQLPRRMIELAVSFNPGLRSCGGFEELHAEITRSGAEHWRNPELFPYLSNLSSYVCTNLQDHVDALGVHVGLVPLQASNQSSRRFWRFHDQQLSVREVDDDQILTHSGLSQKIDPDGPLIYRPWPRLFDDIHSRFYRGDSSEAFKLAPLSGKFRSVLELLKEFSNDLVESVLRRVSVVALMPRQSGEAKSFSMRNFYIGGVFLSDSTVTSLAEQLIHEYYHQCIWPWWLVERPDDLPPLELKLTSPLTGRERPVTVMIQALLIYQSLIDFYRFVVSSRLDKCDSGDEAAAATSRLSTLELGRDPLVRELENALSDRPRSKELVTFLAEHGARQSSGLLRAEGS